MNENFIKLSENKWSNFTFIFPCVSVGNIGQLATDLLISTIPNLRKAGYLINNRLVQPIIGYDPYNQNSNDLCLSVEIYESVELSLVIMQQRAPLFKGKRNEFVKLLVEFIKSENFKEVICLTSSYAYERLDSQLYGSQCRFLLTGHLKTDTIEELMNQLKWLHLEKRNEMMVEDNKFNESRDAYIPGGGIAQKFHKICEDENINSKILIIFAHEGNNIPEAFNLINYLNQLKNYLNETKRNNWSMPISWRYLFGSNIDRQVEAQIF